MRFLRSNTAVIVTVGPFYDKTDGVTIETALTITNERITLTADTDAGSAPTNILDNVTGATSATANDLNYITGNDAGMMQLELAAADVNRVGRMFLSITDAANHVPVFHEFFVLPAAIYDWLTGVIVPLPANTTQFAGQTVTAAAGVTLPSSVASPTNITAATGVDITKILGTAISTPATAGILDINVKNMNNVAATPITTVKAVQGLAVDGVIPTVTNLTNAPTAGDFTATMKTSIGTAVAASAVASVTGSVGSIAPAGISAASFAAGSIDNAAIAADAIGSSELAASAATEIATAVSALACTEPTNAPAASPTLIQAISWQHTLSRNKITQTATDQVLKADDGSTTIATAPVSDDGTTATRGEFV